MKLTLEQLEQLDKKAAEIRSNNKNNHLRTGQILFNCLYEIKPELANEIRGTDCDPFHHDSKIFAFIERIS